MQGLIEYLYLVNVTADHSWLVSLLSKCQPVPISCLPKGSLLNLTPLLVRNIAHYDQSTLNIQLSRLHILMFQRIVKFRKLMATLHKEKVYMELLNRWINNGFFSFTIQKNIQKALQSLIEDGILYEDYSVDKRQHYIFKVSELTRLLCWLTHAQKSHTTYQQFVSLPSEKKVEIIAKKQREKVQDYIIQLFGQDCLLVFRTIQSWKFITEKQLQGKVLLGIIQLRKAINRLVEAGMVSFYAENARTTIYEALSEEHITKRYLDHICKTILNLHVVQQNTGNKQKLIKIQSAILDLDDILLLFQI